MLRLLAFALTITVLSATTFTDRCIGQSTNLTPTDDSVVNAPYDNSGFAAMWTYRTGTDSNSRAFAFRIAGASGLNLQGKLSMYKVKEIEGGKYFEKKKIKVMGTPIDAFTIDCILEPDPKKGYVIKAITGSGDPVTIGVLSRTPDRTPDKPFALIRWGTDKLKLDDVPINNPCEEPPDIGEEEQVAIGSDSATPGPTLSIARPRTVVDARASSATQPE
jgi:hypothetical protein